tara:strand:- start:207 stop:488 length:282 start_codon:yes stop_codon:yes gene_type:complete
MKQNINRSEIEFIANGGAPFKFLKENLQTVVRAVKIGQLTLETEIEDIKEILKLEFGVKLCYYDVKKHLKYLASKKILKCSRVYSNLYFYINN